MKYIDAFNLLPQANYIYIDVTEAELAKIKIPHFMSFLEEKQIVGTLEPIDKLASKELTPGTITF
jgi:hypothetical protein